MYVIDQSACDQGASNKRGLGKRGYSEENGSKIEYLGPFSESQPVESPMLGRTMTKAAFFDAMRIRFGSDGSWRPGRNTTKSSVASANGDGQSNGSDHSGVSFFGPSKRPRKSKISKPMVMLCSSTSVRDGFADRGRNEIGTFLNGKAKGVATTNFTIFGDVNNAKTGTSGNPPNMQPTIPPIPPGRADVSHIVGRAFISSPGAAILAYDRTRSNSDPARNSVHGSVGTGGSPGKRQSGSASAPSLGTGNCEFLPLCAGRPC